MHILLVEESKLISNSLKSIFEDYGYLVDEYSPDKFTLLRNSLNSFDILIVNIDVESDIVEVRKKNPNLCVVGLNTSKNWSSKVKLLGSGFDDILDYPFPAQEILIRIQNILKRPRNTVGTRLKVESLEMDLDSKRVLKGNEEIRLRRKEFCLLEYLIRNKNRTVSRNELLDHVWDYRKINNSNTVDVHIKRLRDKIKSSDIIQTVHGFGYRLNDKKKPKSFEKEDYLDDIS
jgi:DNA-binding response OmpR family regulator